LDISQKLDNLFKIAIKELCNNPDRISDNALRIIGVVSLRNSVKSASDIKHSFKRPIGSEALPRVLDGFDKSLKKAERALEDEDYESQKHRIKIVTDYCNQFLYEPNDSLLGDLARVQLGGMFLRMDVELWKQYKSIIRGFPMVDAEDKYFSYSDLIYYIQLTSPELLNTQTHAELNPDLEIIDDSSFEERLDNAIGRPGEDWERIKQHLLKLETQGQLPEIKHGWRTKAADILWKRYKPFATSPKFQSKTIKNKSVIKIELDRIEKANSETP
jgi:hypothetical protein